MSGTIKFKVSVGTACGWVTKMVEHDRDEWEGMDALDAIDAMHADVLDMVEWSYEVSEDE